MPQVLIFVWLCEIHDIFSFRQIVEQAVANARELSQIGRNNPLHKSRRQQAESQYIVSLENHIITFFQIPQYCEGD